MDLHIHKPDLRMRCALCGREAENHPANGQGCTEILEAIVKHCYMLTLMSPRAVVRARMAEAFPGTQLGLLFSVEKALAICHGIFNPDDWASIAGDWNLVHAVPDSPQSSWNSDEAASTDGIPGPMPSGADSTSGSVEPEEDGPDSTTSIGELEKGGKPGDGSTDSESR